jgi:hypothetical protein
MKMNLYPTLTNIRSHLSDKFLTLQMQAVRDSLWANLLRKNTMLAMFPEQAPEKSPNRTFSGVEDISVEQIVGTLNRQNDFDHKFRPLKKYLRDRWVNTYLSHEVEGWSPILVHKVGEHYYVEDGHHRVSVARSLGMVFIQAKVWEYPVSAKQIKDCQPEPCPERSAEQVYAA